MTQYGIRDSWSGSAKSFPDGQLTMMALLLQNRRFQAHMGNQVSAWRKQLNGLPQGSVLSPTLFNLYTNDLPMTASRKFVYADDICFASQGQSFSELESGLNSDIASISDYCAQWRLTPSVPKTVSSVFHLDNRRASKN